VTKEHFSATAIVWQDQMRKKEEFHHGLISPVAFYFPSNGF